MQGPASELARELGLAEKNKARIESIMRTAQDTRTEADATYNAAAVAMFNANETIGKLKAALAALPLAVPVVAELLPADAFLGIRGIVPDSTIGTRVPS